MGPSILLENVSLTLEGNQILAPISAEITAGRLHILVGPNGAGKTSLLKSLLGLMPHKGEITRHWPNQTSPLDSNKLLPAYIPQQPRFDAVLPVTTEDYLAAIISPRPLFFRQSSKVRKCVAALLEQVGLNDKSGLQLGQLSGGERQRLMFAQALYRNSTLWFLDEPMTGLDGDGQVLITELICQLKAKEHTLVIVHHDMTFVHQHADNVLLIDGGLKSMGTAHTVLGRHNQVQEVA